MNDNVLAESFSNLCQETESFLAEPAWQKTYFFEISLNIAIFDNPKYVREI